MTPEIGRTWGQRAQEFFGGAKSTIVAFLFGAAVTAGAGTLYGLPDRVSALEEQQEMTARVLLAVRVKMCYETNGGNSGPEPTIRYLLRCSTLDDDLRRAPIELRARSRFYRER